MRISAYVPRGVVLPVLLVALAGGLAACGEGGREDAAQEPAAPSPSPARGDAAMIVIEDFTFVPEVLTVTAGEQITVVNRDEVPHTVTAWTGVFESGLVDEDSTYRFSVEEPGNYWYRCEVHEPMLGRLLVTPTSSG